MKHNKYPLILFFAVVSFLFSSCVKDNAALTPTSKFVVNPLQYFKDGSKMTWSADGCLYWDGDGNETFLVNGQEFRLEKVGDGSQVKWYAFATNEVDVDPVEVVIDGDARKGFFISWPSSGGTFDESTGYYYDVYPDISDFPAACYIETNNITLQPAGAVFKVISDGPFAMTIEEGCDENGNFIAKGGTLDPVHSVFVADESEPMEIVDMEFRPEVTDGQRVAKYISLPLTSDVVTVCNITFVKDGETITTQLSSIDIRRGVIYSIDLDYLLGK